MESTGKKEAAASGHSLQWLVTDQVGHFRNLLPSFLLSFCNFRCVHHPISLAQRANLVAKHAIVRKRMRHNGTPQEVPPPMEMTAFASLGAREYLRVRR